MDLALNNLQWLICHKTQQTKQINKLNIKLEQFKQEEIDSALRKI